MSNSAIIKPIDSETGVYLHWNGGPDSVTAFLTYCKMKGYRPFGGKGSDGYGIARFCQVVGNFFGGSTSIGIMTDITDRYADNYENGIYIVDGWDIVARKGRQTTSEGYDLIEMLCSIDDAQPEEERLTHEYIMAEEVEPSELKIGDQVFCMAFDGKVATHTIVGIGVNGKMCNGHDVSGVPYVNTYGDNSDAIADNINNYIREKVRVVKNTKEENNE